VEGYSHGGPLAAFVSAHFNIPALVFGCPKYVIGSRDMFHRVIHVAGERDIVSRLMWPFTTGRHRLTMYGDYEGRTLADVMSGHGTGEYRHLIKWGGYHYGI
jgi:hypothetical protein